MAAALLCLGALLLLRPAPKPTVPAPTVAPPETPVPEPAGLTLRFHYPEETRELRLAAGALLLPEEAPLEGYTFLRWEDAQGEALPAGGQRVWEDGDYYPVYAMRLGRADHAPYLSLDENGAFHPAGPVTRREAVCILYALLDTELVGDGRFLDLAEDDPAFAAAATLKDLGVLSGSRLHPDETVTRREFLAMLCCFFPEGREDFAFPDLDASDPDYLIFCTAAERGWIESGAGVPARPDAELTRLELVTCLSAATDRHGDSDHRVELTGTILDMDRNDPHYWEVAEATLPHRHRGEGARERWTWSEHPPLREEGLFFLGCELHAVGPDGNPVVNGEYAGLRFDENGIETSGDPELDRRIRELLPTLVDPASMEPEEMLRVLFEHTVRRYRYRPGNIYPVGEPSGWEAGEALAMLTEGRGNCYGFAALYYELARAVGFDARAYTGGIIGGEYVLSQSYTDVHGDPLELPANHSPHGWVEIEFDGVPYIFDPEYGYRIHNRGYKDFGFFKLDDHARQQYGYLYSLEEPTSSPTPGPTPET